jgi:serine/threonine protein kinase
LCFLILKEFCNKGTLSDAVERGWFRRKHSLFDADYSVMLKLAKEVASAMAYLHSLNILHGDLTGNNVMLMLSSGTEMDAAKEAFSAKASH